MKYVSSIVLAIVCLLNLSACSINSFAVRTLGDALSSQSGGSGSGNIFTSDNDPELIEASLPVLIKATEALLDSDKENHKLRITLASMYLLFANTFIDGPLLYTYTDDFSLSQNAKRRAYSYYIKAKRVLIPYFLNKSQTFFTDLSKSETASNLALSKLNKNDAGALYYYAAATTLAFSQDPLNSENVLALPNAFKMMQEAEKLDYSFMGGMILEYFISYYGSMPEEMNGSIEEAKKYFTKLEALNGAKNPGARLSYALIFLKNDKSLSEAEKENLIKNELEYIIDFDIEKDPGSRLFSVMAQRKAQYLLDNYSDFF